MSPFSVIWLTPPRGESYVMDCKEKVVIDVENSYKCFIFRKAENDKKKLIPTLLVTKTYRGIAGNLL
jgi:hypothetical protein